MKTETLIKELLNIDYCDDGTISTLSIAIKNARELSGRDIITGKKNKCLNTELLERQIINNTFDGNKFLALVSYLIIIDLIGNIFKLKNKSEIKDNFKHTLKHFNTNIDEEQIKSLKNLRNSLAHKFSLGNETEIFILDYTENLNNNIVERSQEIYHSNIRATPKSEKNMTSINFENICELVENIYTKLKILEKENELEILSKYKNHTSVNIYDIKSMYFIK